MSRLLNQNIQKAVGHNFELLCISLLVESYHKAIADKQYTIDWKENSFTNHLASYMRQSQAVQKHRILVDVQVQPWNNNLPVEKMIDDPDRQPIIDFRLANWTTREMSIYFIEAKNICSKDWIKSGGALVSASKLKRRYINTGIANFVSKRYPKGCLAAYAINSKSSDCVKGVNQLLKKDKRASESLHPSKLLNSFKNSYQSWHSTATANILLKHIFLEF